MSNTAITQGAHHIGLTVPDLAKTSAFFTEALGFAKIGEVADYPAHFLSDDVVMITLWQANKPATAAAFDRKNTIGLHHLAMNVADGAALDALHRRLTETDDVEIEFAPEPLGAGTARHMICAIPGGIRVEFIAA